MKFAFCHFNYLPHSGLSRDFRRILEECQNRGHEVEIFVRTWEGPAIESEPKVTCLNDWRDHFRSNHRKDKAYHNKVQDQLRMKRFDAVIGFNKMPGLDVYYGADVCYIARDAKKSIPKSIRYLQRALKTIYPHKNLRKLIRKILLHAPGFDFRSLYKLTPRYQHLFRFENAVFGTASQTLILSLSKREKKVFQEYYHTDNSRFMLLPPTLSKKDRKPAQNRFGTRYQMRKDFDIEPDELLLLFIGSGFETKGLDRAVKALASLPLRLQQRTQLMVIGRDHANDYLDLAKKLGVNARVHFVGGRDDIREWYAAGDLLIHPAYRENTGTVLLEAIVAGVPVLTTEVCGYAEHVEQAKAGIVLPEPFEQSQLNYKLENILSSPTIRKKWSNNGLRYGENEDLYHMPIDAVDIIEKHCQNNVEKKMGRAQRPDESIQYLDQSLPIEIFQGAHLGQIMQIQKRGELIRTGLGRETRRHKFGNKTYYIKTHTGVGWREIIKNWTYLRPPVLGAKNEWHGVHHLRRHGISTLTIAGYGTSYKKAANRQSFIITEEIGGSISLEELGYEWQKNPPKTRSDLRYKRWLIRRVARMARTIHQSGANHRDFYLCHFLLRRAYDKGKLSTNKSTLHVIDLHRMQIRRQTPERWKLKDISGLRYSCLTLIESGILTSRDLYRFIADYMGISLRETLSGDALFWNEVISKAENLYAAEQRKNVQNLPQQANPAPSARMLQ
ncbi:MAG: lipopolysaccharide core heptose(I) kinase RfaP [Acidiferrobacteraceae bacterium]|nr:lipopolysaccharide core heptose(I) kinase RfaP [Acidiferrobacteraceae bacterium]